MVSRLASLVAAIGLSVSGALAVLVLGGSPAYAAGEDEIDTFAIAYDLQASGGAQGH